MCPGPPWQTEPSAAPVVLRVADGLHVFGVQAAVRDAARRAGFDAIAAQELAIAGSELAWNVVKHARQGEVEVAIIRDPERGPGLAIEARDAGPPFRSFASALLDRHDDTGPIDPLVLARRRGMGSGLGAVARFTDHLEYTQEASQKRVTAVRFVRRQRGARRP